MGRDKQAVVFRNSLIVSCQDNAQWTTRMALDGGCGGLRLNGPKDVKIARLMSRDIPIVACWKEKVHGYAIYITPMPDQVQTLADAGADIIAFDATARKRPTPVKVMVDTIHNAGCLAMADIKNAEEGIAASEAGADYIATTLNPCLNPELVSTLKSALLGKTIVDEGSVWSPEDAKASLKAGADFVCVGSAITRPHEITRKFVEAIK